MKMPGLNIFRLLKPLKLSCQNALTFGQKSGDRLFFNDYAHWLTAWIPSARSLAGSVSGAILTIKGRNIVRPAKRGYTASAGETGAGIITSRKVNRIRGTKRQLRYRHQATGKPSLSRYLIIPLAHHQNSQEYAYRLNHRYLQLAAPLHLAEYR